MTQDRDIIEKYIESMEGINDRKLALTQKILELETLEMRLFNDLRHQLFQIDGWIRYGISQNTDVIQTPRNDDMSPDGAQLV